MKNIVLAPAIAAALAACGDSDFGDGAAQVLARVNGSEIHAQQVTSAIEPTDGGTPSQELPRVTPEALDRFIDQELLVQKAIAAKIDREPQVMEAIAAERRRILGLAYLDRTVPKAPSHSREEIHRFFESNSILFAARRIYETRELVAALPPDKKGQLGIQVSHAADLDDVARWLRSQSLPFRESAATRPAEQIPLEMLPELAQMRDSQIAVFPGKDQVSIVQLVRAREAPLQEAQAQPIIERMLGNRWRLELAMNEVKRLRLTANIEYLGPFAGKRGSKPVPGGAGKLRLTTEEEFRRGLELL